MHFLVQYLLNRDGDDFEVVFAGGAFDFEVALNAGVGEVAQLLEVVAAVDELGLDHWAPQEATGEIPKPALGAGRDGGPEGLATPLPSGMILWGQVGYLRR